VRTDALIGHDDGYLCYFWEERPEIASGSVSRVPGCLGPCQPVSLAGLFSSLGATALASALVTCPVTQKALSLPGKGLDLRKIVAGAGFEPATSGL
jgi:hypothetical protein